MIELFLYGISSIILLFISAYFSACETAITAYSRPKMFTMAKAGNEKAKIILGLQDEVGLVISALLTCNTILNALFTTIGNFVCIELFGDSAIFYCPIIISILIVLCAEVLPKMYTIAHPEKVLLPSAYFVKFTYKFLRPLNNIIGFVAKKCITAILGNDENKDEYENSLDELRGAIELHQGQNSEDTEQEKEMLQSILDLGSIPVGRIMTHRKSVTMLCAEDDGKTLIEQIMNCPFTRLPLWSGNQDNIVGVVHVKDILKSLKNSQSIENVDIKDIALKPWFIPENNDLLAQLQSFRAKREHFAIVVDEYGCFMGIVTLEDIIEEIVGDISDEHDVVAIPEIRKQEDGAYIVDGSINIRDLNREIDSNFKSKTAATIAGLVINSIGIIPDAGQIFRVQGYKFEIIKKHRNQITLIKLIKIAE